jgi:hypothetical protein
MKILIPLIAVLGLVCGNRALADEASAARLNDALAAMKEKATALGEPVAEGVILHFGTTKLNGNYEIVDQIKEKYGCVATFFVKKNDTFIRVSTNVQKEGNRAVGTKLDPAGKAYASAIKGETYRGEADILGSKYDTVYEPLKNAKGEVVGIYFVGFPK